MPEPDRRSLGLIGRYALKDKGGFPLQPAHIAKRTFNPSPGENIAESAWSVSIKSKPKKGLKRRHMT